MRTTTAVTTSPFLTEPCGLACLTVAVIDVADAGVAPAASRRATRITRISRAPVLSATRSRVSFWIIFARSRTSTSRQRLVATAAGASRTIDDVADVGVVALVVGVQRLELRTTFL